MNQPSYNPSTQPERRNQEEWIPVLIGVFYKESRGKESEEWEYQFSMLVGSHDVRDVDRSGTKAMFECKITLGEETLLNEVRKRRATKEGKKESEKMIEDICKIVLKRCGFIF